MQIYSITTKYVDYLRQSFPRVYDNKDDTSIHSRKYIGAVIDICGINYYIPFSSPKEKHDYVYVKGIKQVRKSTHIVKRMVIDGDFKGTLQIGTMIPVPKSELIKYDVEEEKDLRYKDLIEAEMKYIRKNEQSIIHSAQLVYKKRTEG